MSTNWHEEIQRENERHAQRIRAIEARERHMLCLIVLVGVLALLAGLL